jgi:hypothetical protein
VLPLRKLLQPRSQSQRRLQNLKPPSSIIRQGVKWRESAICFCGVLDHLAEGVLRRE